jgi:4-amino-4-deoxy-L-arabinose transferase-like glycosyltransferase
MFREARRLPKFEAIGARLARRGIEPWMLVLGAILLVALGLRLWGIKYGLPFAYQIDEERVYVRKAVQMLDAGTVNPHYQQNPPLLTYLLEAIFAVRYGGARAHELIGTVPDRGELFLTARILVALIGTAAVALLYVAGRRFFDRRTGLVAAALMAVAFLPVFYSHVALNNVPAMAAATLSLIGTAGVLQRGERRDYILAGVGLGMAVATKYIFGIVLLPLLAAAALAPRDEERPWKRELAIGIGVAAGCFAVLDPFALIHPERWLHAVGTQGSLVEEHKYGQDPGDGFATYLRTFTWGLGWVPALAALAGAGLLVREDRRRAWVLVPMVPLFLLYVGLQTRYFGRWLLPAFPVACLLAAHGALRLSELAAGALRRPRLTPALAALAGAALLAQGLVHSVHNDRVLSRPHTLNIARSWMIENIRPQAKVVAEPLRAPSWRSPWDAKASLQYFLEGRLGEQPYPRYLSAGLVDEYLAQGYCWVQASSNYWGLALSDPVVADRAAGYYRALDRHGEVRFSASPWGDVRSPGGPGQDVVGFDYDWTYDFYPLAYDRPGPMVLVYRLHGGQCSTSRSESERAREASRSGDAARTAKRA